jgi:hypothetical protein
VVTQSALCSSAGVTHRYSVTPRHDVSLPNYTGRRPACHHQYPSWVTCEAHVTPVKHSISVLRQSHNEKLKKKWATAWAASPRYRCVCLQDTLTPLSQKFLKYISSKEISRKDASHLFQLCTGHVPLNQYLHRFKRVDNPRCLACGHPAETVEHYLLQCPKYVHKRWSLLRRAGRAPRITKILTNEKLLILLINYIDATKHFRLPEDQPW